MKKIIKTMLTIIMVIVLMSTLILTHAAPVDTVFDEFLNSRSEIIKEFASEIENATNFPSGIMTKNYDTSTYIEVARVSSEHYHTIFGDMRVLTKEQIEKNLESFNFSGFIKNISIDKWFTSEPNSNDEYNLFVLLDGFDYVEYANDLPESNVPISYNELEEIIKSELGNVDINYFVFVDIISSTTALYFESDKGNFFIPAINYDFATLELGKVYTQQEYLSLALDDKYEAGKTGVFYHDSITGDIPASGGQNQNTLFFIPILLLMVWSSILLVVYRTKLRF